MKTYSKLPVQWPKDPKEGDYLVYPDPFSGEPVHFSFMNGEWKHLP